MFDVLRNDYLKIVLIHLYDKHTDLKKNLNFDIFQITCPALTKKILSTHPKHTNILFTIA